MHTPPRPPVQESQLASVRGENGALRSQLEAEHKRLADMEATLRARAARGAGAGSAGMAGGFMSNKKVAAQRPNHYYKSTQNRVTYH